MMTADPVTDHLLAEANAIIETAEDLLSRRDPATSRFWPSEKHDEAFNASRYGFEFNLLSQRGGSFVGADTDEEITAIDPLFPQKAILDSITEVLVFAGRHLRQERSEFSFQDILFEDTLREVCRRHLTRLLAAWYELEGMV